MKSLEKLVKDGGVKLKDMLIKKNPLKNSKREEKNKCFLFKSEKREIQKFPETEIMWVNCETCEAKGQMKVYEGETGRSARLSKAKVTFITPKLQE